MNSANGLLISSFHQVSRWRESLAVLVTSKQQGLEGFKSELKAARPDAASDSLDVLFKCRGLGAQLLAYAAQVRGYSRNLVLLLGC